MINIKSEKGAALMWAIYVLALIVIIGAAYAKSTNNEIVMTSKNANKLVARYVAEAGINNGLLAYENKDKAFPIEEDMNTVNGEYIVEYIEPNILKSTGQYRGSKVILSVEIYEDGEVMNWQEIRE